MNEIFSISEMARLRKVTAETLRHYDRIGLLKPIYVNPETGYRYYSASYRDDPIGTIKELQQIGMSLEDIMEFFRDRNLKKSIGMIEKKHSELKDKIAQLTLLEQTLDEKLQILERNIGCIIGEACVKRLDDRYIYLAKEPCFDDYALSIQIIKIEDALHETIPIIGSNRLGVIVRTESPSEVGQPSPLVPFYMINNPEHYDETRITRVKGGLYASMYRHGNVWDYQEDLEKLVRYIGDFGYAIAGNLLQIVQVDVSVTDVPEEVVIELQIPIVLIE
jgi:DNA-binding transcriptional MerR regulator